MSKAKKLNDDDLLAITSQELSQSIGHFGGKLAEDRRKALQFYLCQPIGDLAPPEIEGRSTVVASDVPDTINWMLPNLMRTFTSGDSACEFIAKQQSSEEMAKNATEYINYIFYQQNNGFQILQTWFTDALLSKNGFLKVWWDAHDVEEREDYQGLSDFELAQLLDSKDVEPIEHTQYIDPYWQTLALQAQEQGQQPPQQNMLHDVCVLRTKKSGSVKIENLPPEQFMINRDALNLEDARFIAHQVQRTRSYLKAAGYKDTDDLTSDDTYTTYSPEKILRDQQNASWGVPNPTPNADPSQDLIWITECYMQVDADGDGISEWRKIVRAGNKVIENEETDGHPFVTLTPIPLPHQFFGMSIADMAMEAQKIKTSVLRSMLDNLYLQVNGRYFAVEGQANLDDLMTSRPGGIVRVRQPGMVGRLDQSMGDFADGFQLFELMENQKENRTGFTRYSQGTDANNLNQTATGVNVITNRADLRMELVARNFAEIGVKDLFNKILKLVCQHQDSKSQIRVAGSWIEMNPREWRDKFELSIKVGLGTGNKDQQIMHLQQLLQIQQQAAPYGLVQPQNVYTALSKLIEGMGFKSPEQFFVDPSKQQVQQQPDPKSEVEKQRIEAENQRLQASMMVDAQKTKTQLEADREKMQAQMAVDAEKTKAQIQIDTARLAFEREKLDLQIQLEIKKAEIAAATQLEIARIRADSQTESLQHSAYLNDQNLTHKTEAMLRAESERAMVREAESAKEDAQESKADEDKEGDE